MAIINALTDAQTARFQEFVNKWTAIGLCTEPADRPRAERGIRMVYKLAGLAPPAKIVWTTSPLAQGLTRAIVLSCGKDMQASVGDGVLDRVQASVRDRVWASVRASVGTSVGASVRFSVGDSVWASVGDSVRASVGASVRASVRVSVGDSVWASVGASVRASVWDSVWASVRASVGASVGASVRASVRASIHDSGYGQHDASWLAFYDFFHEVCGLDAQTQQLRGLWEIAQSAGWFLPHEHICWVAERHQRVRLNARGQLHSHDGMAVQYPDGWGLWAWNGVRVTEQIILRPETLTPEQIAKEQNAQVRQVMVERLGIERVCQMFKAQVVDTRGTYALLMLDVGDGRKRPYLRMKNPSVGVWHVEGVHPSCRTVQEALNWRNGLTPEQIDEVNGAPFYQQGDVILKPNGATTFKSQPVQLT